MRCRSSFVIAALLAGAAPRSAPAGSAEPKTTLAIFPVVLAGDRGSVLGADVRRWVQEVVADRADLRVVSEEQLFVERDGLPAVEECLADPTCLTEELRRVSLDLALVVVVNAEVQPPLIAVRFVNARRRVHEEISTTLQAGGELTAASLRDPIDRLLVRGGFPASGRIEVHPSPPDAQVYVEGSAPDVGSPGMLWLRPGRYVVWVAREGYHSQSRTVDLRSREVKTVELTLEPLPRGVPAWIWIAGSTLVVGATAAIVLAYALPGSACLCVGGAGASCPGC